MEDSVTFFDPTLLFLVGFMVLIWFLMIRPENKRRKSHQEMLSSLEIGDEVVTAGGILGKITKIGDQFLEVTLNDSMKVKVQVSAISNVLPKGTINSI
ncbi:preprotein translocase subunit YajC [Gammaproteobacteria bacterium]|jgi:preprotein translocase subunit YajC|nr:preprotein translocase subunit YajC [Gammaproteobacteria bacterium]|tara:strand:+ start:408 stop:701 length:294 start_codon:yes stop_codon:yes gene_type:complete